MVEIIWRPKMMLASFPAEPWALVIQVHLRWISVTEMLRSQLHGWEGPTTRHTYSSGTSLQCPKRVKVHQNVSTGRCALTPVLPALQCCPKHPGSPLWNWPTSPPSKSGFTSLGLCPCLDPDLQRFDYFMRFFMPSSMCLIYCPGFLTLRRVHLIFELETEVPHDRVWVSDESCERSSMKAVHT